MFTSYTFSGRLIIMVYTTLMLFTVTSRPGSWSLLAVRSCPRPSTKNFMDVLTWPWHWKYLTYRQTDRPQHFGCWAVVVRYAAANDDRRPLREVSSQNALMPQTLCDCRLLTTHRRLCHQLQHSYPTRHRHVINAVKCLQTVDVQRNTHLYIYRLWVRTA